jgi:hypothetical protein
LLLVWEAIEAQRSFPFGKILLDKLAAKLGLTAPFVPAGDFEGLHREVLGLIFACEDRVGRPCNADFNEIVLANPLDGKSHEYTCPKCGVHSVYVAPLLEVSL